ncbi:hypothetical protein OV079_04875 [Nannocystis pusilla]|uniref:Uncharacterized protein n=1 Tax=Nannocystis pusilla TaxID=889268 RepID=A0A9X3EIT9_9BACT|nr:hypothetical protein [Nannocystis pusilla]MCY1004913.1 hypothetical protein [Nannocystis pusilla]
MREKQSNTSAIRPPGGAAELGRGLGGAVDQVVLGGAEHADLGALGDLAGAPQAAADLVDAAHGPHDLHRRVVADPRPARQADDAERELDARGLEVAILGAEVLAIEVERGLAVELEHEAVALDAGAAARGSDRLPAAARDGGVAHRAREREADDGARKHVTPAKLARVREASVVGREAADDREVGAEHRLCAPQHGGAVEAHAVGEQQEQRGLPLARLLAQRPPDGEAVAARAGGVEGVRVEVAGAHAQRGHGAADGPLVADLGEAGTADELHARREAAVETGEQAVRFVGGGGE